MSAMSFREPNEVRWVGVRPAHKGTQILDRGIAINAEVTVYTVPSGKTAYITHIALAIYGNTTGQARVLIKDTGGAIVWSPMEGYSIANTYSFHDNTSYWPPIELPEGYYITVISNAETVSAICNIHGWEE